MGKKILIVDDSVFVWEEMKHVLAETEFEIVGFAKTGEEAIELCEKLQPDLVTMDIILPGMDGLEAARKLLERHADLKIVVVSSLAYDETMDEAKDTGAVAFLFKPFDRNTLLETLTRAVSQ